MSRIPTIVLTGGPCAGKTTALADMHKWLTDRGYHPIIKGEDATALITAGFNPRAPYFQHLVFQKTVAEEKLFIRGIEEYGLTKPVLLLDRGRNDQIGYMGKEAFAKLCHEYGESAIESRDGLYHGVIFLHSAAVGAESFYSFESNTKRYESLEEARALDERTLSGWIGAPHLQIIPNRAGHTFEEKMHEAVRALARILGEPEPLEQERKFLVTSYDLNDLPSHAVGIDIVQTYLVASNPGDVERVRARGQDNTWVYFHTIKTHRSAGVSVERESIISKDEYDHLLIRRDTSLSPIHKKRWCFAHQGHYCELDVFNGHRRGLVLLEIEYEGDWRDIHVPPFLGDVRDVTDDPLYGNNRLAQAA